MICLYLKVLSRLHYWQIALCCWWIFHKLTLFYKFSFQPSALLELHVLWFFYVTWFMCQHVEMCLWFALYFTYIWKNKIPNVDFSMKTFAASFKIVKKCANMEELAGTTLNGTYCGSCNRSNHQAHLKFYIYIIQDELILWNKLTW